MFTMEPGSDFPQATRDELVIFTIQIRSEYPERTRSGPCDQYEGERRIPNGQPGGERPSAR